MTGFKELLGSTLDELETIQEKRRLANLKTWVAMEQALEAGSLTLVFEVPAEE